MTAPFARFQLVTLLTLLLSASASAQDNYDEMETQFGDRPQNTARVEERYRANIEKYKGQADVLVLPGLVARKKEKRVDILAEATGLDADSIVEFLLIATNSGKGYEALVWSYAKPSDVHKALVFIGMKPGKPFDPGQLRMWPKGERVSLSVVAKDPKGGESPPIRIERLVMDKNTEKTLPEVDFVFTGSFQTTGRNKDAEPAYAADVLEPKSVASLFNDSVAVLDVPRRARKSEVYGSLVVGPEYRFAKNELLTIRIEPEYKDGRTRIIDLVMDVRQSTNSEVPFEFSLKNTSDKSLVEKPELSAVLAKFDELIKQGREPFVSVRFDAAMPLGYVQKVCRVINLIDTDGGVHVEPPAPGQLYYEAFLPERRWLDRKNRIANPWEIRLTRDENGLTAAMTLYESHWNRELQDSELTKTTRTADTPDVLRRVLDDDAAARKKADRRPGPPVLLVFAKAELTYGELVEFLSPALTTHNIVHVFLEP